MGIFLIFISFILLAIFSSGWSEITRLGLEGKFIPAVILCLVCCAIGLVLLANERAPQRIKDILTLGEERGTPVWAGVIISLFVILSLFIGYYTNIYVYYLLSVLLVSTLIIGILKYKFWKNERAWNIAGKILYIVGVGAIGVYFAFVNVNLLYFNLGLLIIFGGISYFIKRRKGIRGHSIFAEKNLILYAIVVTIAILLLAQLL